MGQYVRHLNQFHCRIILCWTLATSRSPGFGLIRPRKYCTGIAKLSCIISFGARKSSAGMVQLSVARTYVHLVPENLVPGCLQGHQLDMFMYKLSCNLICLSSVPGSLALGWSSFQGLGHMSILGARKFSPGMFAGSTAARVYVFAQAILCRPVWCWVQRS
jgi:hypothetical protein